MRMKTLYLVILFSFLLLSSNFSSCEATKPKKSRWKWKWFWFWWWWMRHHGHNGHNHHRHRHLPPYHGHHPPDRGHHHYRHPAPPWGTSPVLPPHKHYSPPPHRHYLRPPLPPQKHLQPRPLPPAPHAPPSPPKKLLPSPPPARQRARTTATFNVLRFGAKGDGKTDDTKAFLSTWAAACKVEGSTILVPARYIFLVWKITYKGRDCKENIVFQLDGTIIAPEDPEKWGDDRSDWMVFEWATGLKIQGRGMIDGQGSSWWHVSKTEHMGLSHDNDYEEYSPTVPVNGKAVLGAKVRSGVRRPTVLRIYRCMDVTLSGIKIQNSPNVHLKIMNSDRVTVHDFSTSSPGDSPNTDGIQVHRSTDVEIYHSNFACGDDCVAIQKGCHNVTVYDVTCGPGHGISIGSLGPDQSKACVSNITVRDIEMHDTMFGARIKTWQGGAGSVQGVIFSNIQMSRVQYPIIIDQYYCDANKDCMNQTSAVAVSGITYENIRGTYTEKPVLFACSDSVPCTDITASGINLKPSQQQGHHNERLQEPLCWQIFGEWTPPATPQIGCMQEGKPSTDDLIRSNLNLC